MTDPLDNGTGFDERPQPPAPPARFVAARPAPGRGGRLFRWWLGISLVLAVACVACVAFGLDRFGPAPVHIVIDGNDVTSGLTISGLPDGAQALLAVGAVMLALLVVLLIPLLLLLVMAIVAISLIAGLGVPLVALAFAFAVVSSPLWLIGLLIWLAVRRRPAPRAVRSATMAA